MKRTLKYALSAVLTAAMVVPAMAQDNFPDVPDNHWAFEALARMKREGLLVGYPDGLFRGSRMASRYELAVAVHATYANLKGLIDGLQSQIDAIKNAQSGPTGEFATKADLDNLRQALTALQNDVNALRTQDIADLRRMATTFERELNSLGVDVQAMKKDLADLQDRVSALEKRKLPVDISGDVNFVALGGYSDDDTWGLSVDGRPLGVPRDNPNGQGLAGATRDLSIWHEAAVTLTGTNEEGPKWSGTFVYGNMLSNGVPTFGGPIEFNGMGNQGRTNPGQPFYDGTAGQFYIQDLSVAFDTSVFGLGFNAEIGRVGYKVSPMMFQRPDTTPYYSNDRWDNGEWRFDGVVLGFNFGSAKLNVFGGRNSNRQSSDGTDINPMAAGRADSSFLGSSTAPGFGGRPVGLSQNFMQVDQSLGAHLSFPLTDRGSLNLAYLWLDSNNANTSALIGNSNRVTVYGGDVKFNFGSFAVDAGYSKSDTSYNTENTNTDDNAAMFANIGYDANRWGLKVGFKQIDPLYGAPGDWGRIGIWWNPVDIKGVNGSAWFNLNNDIRLAASGGSYMGTESDLPGSLTEDDKVNHFTVGLEYKMATNYDLAFGYEEVRWDLTNGTSGGNGDPIERWYNIGFGWSLSDKAKLKFLWQINDYKAIGTPSFFVPGPAGSVAKGGLITTQLSVKF